MTLTKLHHNRGGFTLVEIMIVVAIIALLAAIAVPNFLRARKRSQATRILEDLRLIDAAVDQYAIENDKKVGDAFAWSDVSKYVKQGTRLYNSNGKDIHGHEMVGGSPKIAAGYDQHVRVCYLSFDELSDVAPAEFWSPFQIENRGPF